MESHQSSSAALLGRLPCKPARWRCARGCPLELVPQWHARAPRLVRPVPQSDHRECSVWVPGVAGASAARDSRQPCAAASGCRCYHWKIATGERCGNGGVRAKTLRKTPSDLSGDPCRGRPCAASPTTVSAGREPSIRIHYWSRLSRMINKAHTTRLPSNSHACCAVWNSNGPCCRTEAEQSARTCSRADLHGLTREIPAVCHSCSLSAVHGTARVQTEYAGVYLRPHGPECNFLIT